VAAQCLQRRTFRGVPAASYNFEALLVGAIKVKASDVHLVPNSPPIIRVHSQLRPVAMPVLTPKDIAEIVEIITSPAQRERLERDRGVDFAYQYKIEARFRCVACHDRENLCLVFRIIPFEIPTLEALEMPPVLSEIASTGRGMILVTGITGSGKSTTLAAMLNQINERVARRVITIEDPIEYFFPNRKCVITQREVGRDVNSFHAGLRQALRMDPDIIMIGEMRDVETISTGIHAAETGHIVMSTLHTTSALHTVLRIIGQFPKDQHDMVREQISMNLKAAITQRLVRRANGKGRIAALEILVVNDVVAKLIRDDRVMDCFGIIRSRDAGMQAMDQALADLVREEKVTFQEATEWCDDFYALKRFVAGMEASGESGGII
jgi:twitching motility protein PilT